MFKFQTLTVWQKSIDFSDVILDIVESFPRSYHYNLGDQLKRAVISIPTNVAEACGRRTRKEQRMFYSYAKGSCYEVVSLLTIASRRRLLQKDVDRVKIYNDAEEIAKMLSGLINKQ